ncbi:hypothetical protein [Bradyrhizobium neotropicale]|uniref:hypothetical protein n=1 Tax=Bradyrhizobium neotropicale TaxID=1497615 RepID=UPI001AD778F8|nr:hypothetical protein [Bradyrhizobium neotropicale]MBO4228009.1 hypothetical protein [Bradyrhizobium neotropicale]
MADTYANPYGATSPIGAALKNLSGVLTRKTNEAADIAHLETALAAKQKRENTAALGDTLRRLGSSQFDRNAAIDTAVRAGIDPNNLGGYERYYNANTYGAGDQRTSNAFVGAGGAFGSTAQGTREAEAATDRRAAATLAQAQSQFDAKPTTVNSPAGPIIVRQSEAYGQPAVEDIGKVKGAVARNAYASPGGLAGADKTTQQFIGAEGKGQPTPHNYVVNGQNLITYDGVTDAASGQPLPPGGYLANAQGPAKDVGLNSSVVTDLQKQDIANQQFKNLMGYTRNLAQKDPNNFGVTGIVKGAVQDVNAIAGNVAHGLGYSGIQDAAAAARDKAISSGVDPSLLSGVFDPNLPALHTAADLMVFSAAQALAGQSGRSVTDRDVKMFKNIVGDPNDVMGNQQKYLSKLDTIEQILQLNQDVIDKNLSRAATPTPARPGAPGASAPTPAPGAQPSPAAAPPPQPSTPAPIVWGRDAAGNPVPMGSGQ